MYVCICVCICIITKFFIILGECSYEVIDEFLMFTLELLINEKMLTNTKFLILRKKAGNLTFEDAQNMLEVNIYRIHRFICIC